MRQGCIERRSIEPPPSCAFRPGMSIVCWRAIASTGEFVAAAAHERR